MSEREADDMERRSEALEKEIEETRSDWESKKSDETVPGAQQEEEERDEGLPPEADITPGD
jgi:hypothetical protein